MPAIPTANPRCRLLLTSTAAGPFLLAGAACLAGIAWLNNTSSSAAPVAQGKRQPSAIAADVRADAVDTRRRIQIRLNSRTGSVDYYWNPSNKN